MGMSLQDRQREEAQSDNKHRAKPQTMDSMVMPYDVLRAEDECPELTRLATFGAVETTTVRGNNQGASIQELRTYSAATSTKPLTLKMAMSRIRGLHL